MKSVFLAAITFLSVTAANAEGPLETRTEEIRVGASTSAERQLDLYKNLLSMIDREITDVQILSKNGLGHIMRLQFTHEATKDISCDNVLVEHVGVPWIGDLEEEVSETIRLMKMGTVRFLDMEIAGTFGTGRLASVDLYYCKK